MEKFAIGLIIGGVAGALLTANNYKMRTLVKKGQEEVQAKLDELMDDKIKEMEQGAQKMGETIKEKADDATEAVKEKVNEAAKKVEKKTRPSSRKTSAKKKTSPAAGGTPATAAE